MATEAKQWLKMVYQPDLIAAFVASDFKYSEIIWNEASSRYGLNFYSTPEFRTAFNAPQNLYVNFGRFVEIKRAWLQINQGKVEPEINFLKAADLPWTGGGK